MALPLVRGKIIAPFRFPTVSLNGCLNGCLRPSAAFYSIEDQINTSLGSLSAAREDSDYLIKSLASYVTTKIDEIVKFGKPPLPYVYAAEVYVIKDHTTDTQDVDYLRYLSKVADFIQNIPGVDKIQIFHAKIFYRSMLNDDSKSDLTKDDIISRVVNVTQSYPKVGDYKVTEETHFVADLGFDKWDSIEIIQALQMEFKLYIPDDINSCKLAIDYIYDHRTERLSKEEFQKHLFLTGEFGESKSELRRIFVRDKKIETNCDDSDLQHHSLCPTTATWNGFKPTQYFQSLRYCSLQWTGYF